MEAKGKAKQVQASAMHMTSKIKDKTKGFIDGLKRKLKIPKKLRIRF